MVKGISNMLACIKQSDSYGLLLQYLYSFFEAFGTFKWKDRNVFSSVKSIFICASKRNKFSWVWNNARVSK